MADSSVAVANEALMVIGDKVITTFDEDSDRARAVNVLYTPLLDRHLRAHRWNFAERRGALAEVAAKPVFGFAHQYQLPQDPFCLRVFETSLADDEAYRIEAYADATSSYRVLVTDASSVSIVYGARITDTLQWDALFAHAFAIELAYQLSYALTRNADLKTQLGKEATEAWRQARSVDGQEGRPLTTILSQSFTKVR